MKQTMTAGLVALSCLMFASNVFAQAPKSTTSFESLETGRRLKAGEEIEITEVSGKKTTVTFENISRSGLTVRDGRSSIRFKEADIAQIRHRKPERWWDGMLIGMGVGAALGWVDAGPSCPNDPECKGLYYAQMLPVLAGIGAGIGYAVDRHHHKDETLYFRNTVSVLQSLKVVPIAGKTKAGVRLSFSF